MKFEYSPGIYYDFVQHLKFYDNTWKIITYLDIGNIEQKIGVIENIYLNTKPHCYKKDGYKIDKLLCHSHMQIIENQIPKLKAKDNNLKDLVGHHKRTKRGWFNIVGNAVKVITGNLDDNDAKFYNEAINKVEANERETTSLLKSQIQVVQSTITNFNESINKLHTAEETFNYNINQIRNYTGNIENERKIAKIEGILSKHLSLLTLIINEVDSELDNLIDAVLFAKSSALHPKILSPKQFIKELQTTSHALSPGLSYPFPLEYEIAHELLNLIDLHVYFLDNKLIFIIENPLVTETLYNLYKLLPLPVQKSNNLHIFIQPSEKYLGISQLKVQYSPLSDLNNCKTIFQGYYIYQNRYITLLRKIHVKCNYYFQIKLFRKIVN